MQSLSLAADKPKPEIFFWRRESAFPRVNGYIHPQMPIHQLKVFTKIAAQNHYLVAVQLDSELYQGEYIEIIGFISPRSEHERVIVIPYDQKNHRSFNLKIENIRHIRRFQ